MQVAVDPHSDVLAIRAFADTTVSYDIIATYDLATGHPLCVVTPDLNDTAFTGNDPAAGSIAHMDHYIFITQKGRIHVDSLYIVAMSDHVITIDLHSGRRVRYFQAPPAGGLAHQIYIWNRQGTLVNVLTVDRIPTSTLTTRRSHR